jgi:hypothetical protein
MTTPQETQRIVRTYHDAWVNGDFATAGSVLADELINPHTLNKFESSPMSRETYLVNLKQFQQIATGATLVTELYGPDEGILIYDLHTRTPLGNIRTAEHFRVSLGKITFLSFIIDATEWHAFRARHQPEELVSCLYCTAESIS